MKIDWTEEEIGKIQCDVMNVNELNNLKKLKDKWEIELSVAQRIINMVDELEKLKKKILIKEVDELDNSIIKKALERVFYEVQGYSDERACIERAKNRLVYDNEKVRAAIADGHSYTGPYQEIKSKILEDSLNGINPFETKKTAHRIGRAVTRSHFIRALRFKFTLERVGKMVPKDSERLDDAAIRVHCKKSKKYLEIPTHLEDILHEVAFELYEKLQKDNKLKAYLWGEKSSCK